jgi:tetratricopeptide (TPR) repeat protein
MTRYRDENFRETLLRAIQLGEVPSLDDLISLLEDVEETAADYDAEIEQLTGEIDELQKEVEDANRATETAQERLEKMLQAAADTPEALASEVIKLRVELADVRTENVKLREAARGVEPKRRRSKKQPAPKVIFPTYEIPKDAPNVVRVAFGARDPARAQELYVRGCELDEETQTLKQAEKLYREAIRLDPSLAIARTNLGNVRYRQGFKDEAVSHYQDALRIDPTQPEAPYNMGVILHDDGEPGRALPLFEMALRFCPKKDDLRADIHYRIASSRDEVGDVEGARFHWKVCAELDPDSEWGRHALSFLASTESASVPAPASTKHKPALTTIRGGRDKEKK